MREDVTEPCLINHEWCNSVTTMAKDKVLREAIRRAGGVRALARELGVSHVAVIRWDRVPPLRVLEIERITGVSRYRLRPDVYGPEPK